MSMELQTSFIPKRTLDTAPVRRADTVSVFTVLSTLIFFVSLILAGLVFFRQTQLQSEIKALQKEIAEKRDSFRESDIRRFVTLDNRLMAADSLLRSHIYTSRIFDLLQKNTIEGVRFTKLTIDPSQTSRDTLKVAISGQAADYASIALQSVVLFKLGQTNNGSIVYDYEFSNLTLDQAGRVLFDLSATVARSITQYDVVPPMQADISEPLSRQRTQFQLVDEDADDLLPPNN